MRTKFGLVAVAPPVEEASAAERSEIVDSKRDVNIVESGIVERRASVCVAVNNWQFVCFLKI
jgi:hypothetical protein